MNLCPKCQWALENYNMTSHKNRECIANLSADIDAMRNKIAEQHERLAKIEKAIEVKGKKP